MNKLIYAALMQLYNELDSYLQEHSGAYVDDSLQRVITAMRKVRELLNG